MPCEKSIFVYNIKYIFVFFIEKVMFAFVKMSISESVLILEQACATFSTGEPNVQYQILLQATSIFEN